MIATRKRSGDPMPHLDDDEAPPLIPIKKKTKKTTSSSRSAAITAPNTSKSKVESEFVSAEVGMRELKKRLASIKPPTTSKESSTSKPKQSSKKAQRDVDQNDSLTPPKPTSCRTTSASAASSSRKPRTANKTATTAAKPTSTQRKPRTKATPKTLDQARADALAAQLERIESRVQALQQLSPSVLAAVIQPPIVLAQPAEQPSQLAQLTSPLPSTSGATTTSIENQATLQQSSVPFPGATLSNPSPSVRLDQLQTPTKPPSHDQIPATAPPPTSIKSEFIAEDDDEDLAFLEALEQVERKLQSTPAASASIERTTQAPPTPTMRPHQAPNDTFVEQQKPSTAVAVKAESQAAVDHIIMPHAADKVPRELFPVPVCEMKEAAVPLSVLEEFERLKRENEALRLSNERLQQAAAAQWNVHQQVALIPPSTTSETIVEPSAAVVESTQAVTASSAPVERVEANQSASNMNNQPEMNVDTVEAAAFDQIEKQSERTEVHDALTVNQMDHQHDPTHSEVATSSPLPETNDESSQQQIPSPVCEAAVESENAKLEPEAEAAAPDVLVKHEPEEHHGTTAITHENAGPPEDPRHVSMKIEEGLDRCVEEEGSNTLIDALPETTEEAEDAEDHDVVRPPRARLQLEESSTETEEDEPLGNVTVESSESEDDEKDDSTLNVLEAALKAAAAPKKRSVEPIASQPNGRKRPRTTTTSSSASRSLLSSSSSTSASKGTLLWPNLDDFYDFILQLAPRKLGPRNLDFLRHLRKFFAKKRLPAQYESIKSYASIQLEAILEEMVASVRNAEDLTSFNARKRLYLTSVSPCGSSKQLNTKTIFLESGFSGTTSNDHDVILTFHANAVKKSASTDFMNGDLVLLTSPAWKSKVVRLFGIVLCNSMVAIGAAHGNANENDQICVLVRTSGESTAELFQTMSEMCLSNQNAPQWRWTLENVHNLTTSAREYQAIKSIRYLSPELTQVLVSGRIETRMKEEPASAVQPTVSPALWSELERKYNRSQLDAIMGSIGDDKQIIIQGPPGTGKTKTILGILSALLDGAALSKPKKSMERTRIRIGASLQESSASFKVKSVAESSIRILVTAPSNAAVDELLVRLLSEGVYNGMTNTSYRPRIVRVGRPESLQQASESREVGGNLKIRKKLRKYAREVEQVLVENLVTKHRTAFPSTKMARQAIIKNAQIVFCTLSGAGSVAMCDFAQEFDAVIVDEAAQAVEASTLIPFKFKPSRTILVGDHRQLPATVISKKLIDIGYDRSLFERFVANGSPVFLLNQQYRMHPDIAAFPSKQFYDNKLTQQPQLAQFTARQYHTDRLFAPFVFYDVVQGQQSQVHGSKSLRNLNEVEFILLMVQTLIRKYGHQYDWKKKIGIIAPYKQQIYELQSEITKWEQQTQSSGMEIEVNTVDGFQGREKEVIIYSCVRTSSHRSHHRKVTDAFWADVRRMNVAITRAKSSLWIIGNSTLLQQSPTWKALIDDAKCRGMYQPDQAFLHMLDRTN